MPSSLTFAGFRLSPPSGNSFQGSWGSPNAVFHKKTGSTGRQVRRDAPSKHLCTSKAREAEAWKISPLGGGTRGNDGKPAELRERCSRTAVTRRGLSSPPACRLAGRKAAASSPSSWSELALCSHSRQWRSSWEGRSGPCRSSRSRGAGSPATPTWWCRRGRCRCTWTADALAGCGWCSGPSSRRSSLCSQVRGRRRQGTALGLQTGEGPPAVTSGAALSQTDGVTSTKSCRLPAPRLRGGSGSVFCHRIGVAQATQPLGRPYREPRPLRRALHPGLVSGPFLTGALHAGTCGLREVVSAGFLGPLRDV